MKHLFITLEVQDGERQHTHRVLHTSNAQNIYFAAERYASTYWGYGKHDGNHWWFNNEITVTVKNVIELTEHEFKLMDSIFMGVRRNVNDFFQIVHQGWQEDLQREEIQIHAGENGNLFLIKTEEGFIFDVYNQEDFVDSLLIWDDDLEPTEE